MDDYFRQYGFVLLLGIVAVTVPTSLLVFSWLLTKVRVRPLGQAQASIFLVSLTVAPTLGNDSMLATLNFSQNSISTATMS